MQVAEKNIMVFPYECSSSLCAKNCHIPLCRLCRQCLSKESKITLFQAYREHMNKGECKRVYPPPLVSDV